MAQTDVSIEWGQSSNQSYHEVVVHNLTELDAVLDRIAAESDPAQPDVATVVRGEASMAISEGRDWAILSFAYLPLDGRYPQHVSLGDHRARGEVVVMFSNEWTELPRWSCIEPALAREAMHFFYQTGGLYPRAMWAPSPLRRLLHGVDEMQPPM